MFFNRAKKKVISVDGMTDNFCAEKIGENLVSLVDVSKVKVDLKKKCIIVSYENSVDDILLQETIEKMGYIVTGIKEIC